MRNRKSEKMITKEQSLILVSWIVKNGTTLTPWESSFIKMIQQKSLLSPLSRNEEKVINKIYTRSFIKENKKQ